VSRAFKTTTTSNSGTIHLRLASSKSPQLGKFLSMETQSMSFSRWQTKPHPQLATNSQISSQRRTTSRPYVDSVKKAAITTAYILGQLGKLVSLT